MWSELFKISRVPFPSHLRGVELKVVLYVQDQRIETLPTFVVLVGQQNFVSEKKKYCIAFNEYSREVGFVNGVQNSAPTMNHIHPGWH